MSKKFRPDVDVVEWTGAERPYDLLKEGFYALIAITVLVAGLAALFGSPDDPAVTLKQWSIAAPVDFAQTAFSELNGTSDTATYGAPYNTNSPGQALGPLHIAQLVGVHIPIAAARDFVLAPLEALPANAQLRRALHEWSGASAAQRTTWLAHYGAVAPGMTFSGDSIVTASSASGPVPEFINDLTLMARSGALDEALLTKDSFYTTDFTKGLLFLSNGAYLTDQANAQHLLGSQWGMMNETGTYPGQAWLWLYTFWYQIPPYTTSGNADILVGATMGVLTVGLIFLPFIPGLRSIPRRTRLYRLVWRGHYRREAQGA